MSDRQSTDDLIRALAAAPAPAPFNPVVPAGAMFGLAAGGLAAFLVVFGLRPDLGAAWQDLGVQAKSLLPAVLCALALWLVLRASRPGTGLTLWPLALPLGAVLAMALLRLAGAEGALRAEVLGQTALACLTSITALSLVPLVAGILLLRRAASTRPVLTGALAGVAVSAGVASGYALHCTEDSPLFFGTWYGLAIGMVALVGAWLGHRFLRW
ncbi:NrsF family protein [Pseudotabrizicola algicola]|uniref:DUF1109 domain-containing protein n=1 Tax=Pseudotabrizicola algicola TaxID=2709381 RepID=A0A6B3RV34_9RHOB|nr:DUF1109 domain-containing protein [Pseudotabrizicola algicola]NEX48658.1 DUF1109 domain-containing protein [Pseudotabrizicola algicola]